MLINMMSFFVFYCGMLDDWYSLDLLRSQSSLNFFSRLQFLNQLIDDII